MPLPVTWSLLGEYFIPHRVQMLARMIDRETGRELQAHFNLSVADWRVLGLTNTFGSASAAEICSAFEIDRAEVSRAVARLIEAGLVERDDDPRHRSKKQISPTEKGKAIFQRAVKMRESYFTKIMQDLSTEEMKALDQALRAIALRVDEFRHGSDDQSEP
jgi:DNA-binding MarR family transcriptional regulator